MRRVVLVCGPPCAGKTTYVAEHAAPGDYVVDFDDFARQAGSDRQWQHRPEFREAAETTMTQALDYIAESDDERAWVIRSLPNAADRDHLADYLRADEVVVLDPGIDVCLARAHDRPFGTVRGIRSWYASRT